MSLSAFVVIALLVAAAEILLGALTAVLAWRAVRAASATETSAAAERRAVLPLAASRLAFVAVVSAPVAYVLLRSQVSEWPGVMCVQGVLNLGSHASGPASWLPALVTASAVVKTLLLLTTGAWVTLQALDRETRTGALARSVVRWIAAAGIGAVLDGALQIAYVAIPRTDHTITSGCCTIVASAGGSAGVTPDAFRNAWTAGFFALGTATLALLATALRGDALPAPGSWWWPGTALTAAGTAVTGAAFFSSALSPARLALPLHECSFCLVDKAPETWAGVVLALGATACVLWAWLASRKADAPELAAPFARVARRLLGWAAFGMAGALLLAAVERWLA